MFASRFSLIFGAVLALAVSACQSSDAAPNGPLRVDVKVDEKGYTPAEVKAEAGRPLTLVFTRADENNCGETLVFPGRDIKKSLPVGKPVEVSFTPKADERIAFTCGMGMYKGAVVVVGAGG